MYAGTRTHTSRLRLVMTSASLIAQPASCPRLGERCGMRVSITAMASTPRCCSLPSAGRSAGASVAICLRGVPGDSKEHVVERRTVQREVDGLNAGGIEAAHRVDERLR